jgi:subtilisin-like proprotein convertase family protein
MGTESILAHTTRFAQRGYDYNDWCFASVRNFGEQGQGDWILTVSDRITADTGTFQSWSVRIYGTTANVNTITASADTGGTIVPVGSVAVGQGWDRDFTITPSSGYSVADVLVDGTSVGAQTSYTFTNVTADHTISASFTSSSSNDGDGDSGSSGCFILTTGDKLKPLLFP